MNFKTNHVCLEPPKTFRQLLCTDSDSLTYDGSSYAKVVAIFHSC